MIETDERLAERTARTDLPGAADSAAAAWPPLARFVEADRRLGAAAAARGRLAVAAYEFLRFGLKQAWACLFGALLLGLLIVGIEFAPARPVIGSAKTQAVPPAAGSGPLTPAAVATLG